MSAVPQSHSFFAFDPRGGVPAVRPYLGLSDDAGARALALRVMQQFEELRDSILLPILQPAIAAVLKQVHQIDRLLLVGTDQSPDAGEFHRRDTIESARFIAQVLHTRFPSVLKTIEEPLSCRVDNPSRQEAASDFMRQLLLQHVPRQPDLCIFASVRGGLPALNASLRQHIANIYGGQGFLVETAEPVGGSRGGQTGHARILSTWPLRCDAVVRLVQQALEGDNYLGALAILTSEGITDPFLVGALKHAHRRQNLDFAAAVKELHGLAGPATPWAESAARADEDAFQRLAEVCQTAVSCLDSGDYIGFLTRLEAFAENARRVACELLIGVQFGGAWLTVQALREVNSPVAEALESRLSPHQGRWTLGRKLYRELMDIGGQSAGKRQEVATLHGQLHPLEALERLRNRVIHELLSVSKNDLDRAFSRNIEAVKVHLAIVLGQVRKLSPTPSPTVHNNVFDRIKREVSQRLEKLDPLQELS